MSKGANDEAEGTVPSHSRAGIKVSTSVLDRARSGCHGEDDTCRKSCWISSIMRSGGDDKGRETGSTGTRHPSRLPLPLRHRN